jgi:hypothetical protein
MPKLSPQARATHGICQSRAIDPAPHLLIPFGGKTI